MMSAAAKVSDDDAANLAAHFAELKCESTLTADKQATLPGHAIASKCTACHGANGMSSNPSWPNLVGQSKAYLVNALKHYSSGARKNAIMAGIVKGLSDVGNRKCSGLLRRRDLQVRHGEQILLERCKWTRTNDLRHTRKSVAIF